MADPIWRIQYAKSYLIEMKFDTRGFLESLITNPSSKIRNSKWRIQDGWQKFKKSLDWDDIRYSGVFRVADYKSELTIQKFKMADRIWRTKMQKVTWLGWNSVLASFRITDYEFEINIQKLKMTDPICKKLLDWNEIWYSGLFGVANYKSELENWKFRMSDAIWWTKMLKTKFMQRRFLFFGF